jgi:hypothetical protein
MERSFAVGVVTSITSHISQLDIMWRRLVDPLTIGTFTIAAVVISETTGDGECMTAEVDFFNLRANQGGPENSRGDKADVTAGSTARTRRVLQGRFDKSTMFAVEKAVPWGEWGVRRTLNTPDARGMVPYRFGDTLKPRRAVNEGACVSALRYQLTRWPR